MFWLGNQESSWIQDSTQPTNLVCLLLFYIAADYFQICKWKKKAKAVVISTDVFKYKNRNPLCCLPSEDIDGTKLKDKCLAGSFTLWFKVTPYNKIESFSLPFIYVGTKA